MIQYDFFRFEPFYHFYSMRIVVIPAVLRKDKHIRMDRIIDTVPQIHTSHQGQALSVSFDLIEHGFIIFRTKPILPDDVGQVTPVR